MDDVTKPQVYWFKTIDEPVLVDLLELSLDKFISCSDDTDIRVCDIWFVQSVPKSRLCLVEDRDECWKRLVNEAIAKRRDELGAFDAETESRVTELREQRTARKHDLESELRKMEALWVTLDRRCREG